MVQQTGIVKEKLYIQVYVLFTLCYDINFMRIPTYVHMIHIDSVTSIHALLPQEGLVNLLLDAGANIDAQSVNGGTPIMRAIETSQKEIVKLLIERGYAQC